MDTVESPFGVWINKREVMTLGYLFKHSLTPTGAGWRLEAKEKGQLVISFQTGSADTLDLDPGDYILGSGDDFYVKLQRRPAKVPPGRGA